MNSRDSSSIIYPPKNQALNGLSLEEFKKIILGAIPASVQEVYLFGSYASGNQRDNSDIDIIVVAETDLPFLERINDSDFSRIFSLSPMMDLLIYTPEEFKKLTTNPTAGLWSHVTKTMVKIL